MTILIHPLPELGHLLPTFPLAAALRARGHRVVYATILDFAESVEAHGFECAPVLRDVHPRGYVARMDRVAPDRFGLVEKIVWMRQDDELFAGRLLRDFEAYAPRLVLVDTISAMVAMAARERGIPCLRYSTALSQRIGGGPPITTGLLHDAPPVQRAAAAAASGCLTAFVWQVYEHALVRFGYPAGEVSFATVFTPELRLAPELVLPPAALELPGAAEGAVASGAIHASVPIDGGRAEHVPEGLERALDGRPLVYVALGTQAHRYPAAGRLLRAVLLALRARPEWQAVVAAGEHATALAADCPANVILLARAPQLWVLRRAAVFVTHAGMGALREAVALHVPMLAIPQGYDQPGNAARIEHHGIGIQLPCDAVDPARLVSCIERILGGRAGFVERLRRLDEACAAEAASDRALRLIEEQLASPSGGRQPPPSPGDGRQPPTSPGGGRLAGSPLAKAVEPERGSSVLGWLFVAADAAGHAVLGNGSSLRAGSEPELPSGEPPSLGRAGFTSGEPPSLGRAGFTICPSIGHALSRAEGSLLARVELSGDLEHAGPYVTGRKLRCLWQLDAGELLSDLAIRWVEAALAAERVEHPELAAYFVEAYASHRADADRRAELERAGSPLRHRGYQVGLDALEADAHDAARFARNGLILFACRDEGAGEGYLRTRERVIGELDAELERVVAEAAARAGVTPS